MILQTFYKTYAWQMEQAGGEAKPGSLEINGGTVNVYFSNQEAEPDPMDPTEYTVDPDGPYEGTIEIAPAARWIAVIAATGAPVVRDFRVIV